MHTTAKGRALTGKAELLIMALLTEPTQRDAARAAGVSSATIARWMRVPAFRQALDDSRKLYREEVAATLARLSVAEYHAALKPRQIATIASAL